MREKERRNPSSLASPSRRRKFKKRAGEHHRECTLAERKIAPGNVESTPVEQKLFENQRNFERVKATSCVKTPFAHRLEPFSASNTPYQSQEASEERRPHPFETMDMDAQRDRFFHGSRAIGTRLGKGLRS